MIRRVLVALDPSEYAVSATQMACELARLHDSEVTGVVLVDVPGIERAEAGVPIGAIHYAEKAVQHRVEEAGATLASVLDRFNQMCRAAKLRHTGKELQGDPVRCLMNESRYHDLLVMGLRSSFHFATKKGVEQNLDEVVDHTITPVVAVPKEVGELRRALVFYDGCLPAARSLQRFAHLVLAPRLAVTVVNANDDPEEAQDLLQRAEEYLRAYGVERIEKRHTEGDLRQALDAELLDQADLVVTGFHCRKRLVGFVVGSFTKYLIKRGDRTLFLAQ